MVKKFECLKCGNCCRNFGNNGALVGLPLFEWEKTEFEKLAKERGILLSIPPTNLMFDKNSGLYTCITFGMENQPCPFLKNNTCSIYEKRPIVCRSFPLAKSPTESETFDLSYFIHCPNFNSKLFLTENFNLKEGEPYSISNQKVLEEYLKIFGEETLINQEIHHIIGIYIQEKIEEMISDNIIDLKKVNKKDYLNHIPIPLFEFLVKKAILSQKEKEEIISKLTSYEHVKKLLFLN